MTSSGTYCTTTNYCFNEIYRITSNLKFTDIIGNILYNHNLLLNKIYRMTSNLKFTDIIWNILYNHNLLL